MHRKLAEELVTLALPCPFCGARLVCFDGGENFKGYWIGHPGRTKRAPECIAIFIQIDNEGGLESWNSRTEPPRAEEAT